MQRRQLVLFGKSQLGGPPLLEHGADVRRGKRKVARPVDTKRPLHIVLRSSRAKRSWSMLRPDLATAIRRTVGWLARRYDVRLYRYANVGNHLHMLASVRLRAALQDFLRVFAGATAQLVTGARKGRPVGKFWDRLAYSRVVSWGRDYISVCAYVRKNHEEALGLRPREDRGCGRAKRLSAASPLMAGLLTRGSRAERGMCALQAGPRPGASLQWRGCRACLTREPYPPLPRPRIIDAR